MASGALPQNHIAKSNMYAIHVLHVSVYVCAYLSQHDLVEVWYVIVAQGVGDICGPVGLTACYHHLTWPLQHPLCTGNLQQEQKIRRSITIEDSCPLSLEGTCTYTPVIFLFHIFNFLSRIATRIYPKLGQQQDNRKGLRVCQEIVLIVITQELEVIKHIDLTIILRKPCMYTRFRFSVPLATFTLVCTGTLQVSGVCYTSTSFFSAIPLCSL